MSELLKRTISGLAFLAVMVAGVIFDRLFFACLFLFILWMGMKEFYCISLGNSFKFQQTLGKLAGMLMFLYSAAFNLFPAAKWEWLHACLLCVLLVILLLPVTCLFRSAHDDHGNIAYIYAGLLYIALPISLAPFIVMDGDVYDGWLLLSFFIVVWISDVGAYCIGSTIGQKPQFHKLAPSISPNKSWWGLGGALLFGTAASLGLHFLTWFPFDVKHCIAVGLIISAGTVCGDLVESLWKRYFHVKDSGNLIPGHGGVLDRFDSSLVAIPLACIYLSLFGLI